MTARVVAFMTPRTGQARTTLIYHLAWMFADLGKGVLVVDLDSQGTLTERFLGADLAAALDEPEPIALSVKAALESGPRPRALPIPAAASMALLRGDVRTLELEEEFERSWWARANEPPSKITAIWALRDMLLFAAREHQCDLVLMDLPPFWGALHRGVLGAADGVVIPVVPDAMGTRSLQAIQHQIDAFRREAPGRPAMASVERQEGAPVLGLVPTLIKRHGSQPIGAQRECLQELREEHRRWMTRSIAERTSLAASDPLLGELSSVSGLFQLAIEAEKPAFDLTPADGAVGSLLLATHQVRREVESIARALLDRLALQGT